MGRFQERRAARGGQGLPVGCSGTLARLVRGWSFWLGITFQHAKLSMF